MTVATPQRPPVSWGTTLYLAGLHIAALPAILPRNFSWGAILTAFLLYCITEWGITVGFHRFGSHRSFQTSKPIEYFFIFLGTLACQGSPIDWIGLHRIHHKYSDKPEDPHDSSRGFWWSHLGWMIYKNPADDEVHHYVKDIENDPFYKFCGTFMIPIQVLLGLALWYFGGWSYVVWGIFVRLVVVFHCTWLVNSATHQFGYITHDSGDTSRNCWWVALLTFGEGWHNNHHAFEYSARHGLKWWEIDMTWMIIKSLENLGLAWKVKLPPKKALETV